MTDKPLLTAGQKLFTNDLIMDKVYSYLSKENLISCIQLCESGIPNAATALYKDAPEDIHQYLIDAECPFVSSLWLLTYRDRVVLVMKSTSIVPLYGLYAVNPIN